MVLFRPVLHNAINKIPITKFQIPNKFKLPNFQMLKTPLTPPSPLGGEGGVRGNFGH
jgi:hypothetical protein